MTKLEGEVRLVQLLLFHAFVAGGVAVAYSHSSAFAAPISGTARAIDGDSLMVGETEVRLFGIDAPEFSQSCQRGGQDWECGSAAADRLARLVNGKAVQCVRVDIDEHGRTVARCSVDGTDINQNMVASGYAVAFRQYSTAYVSAEESAKANKRGIWAGTFSMPQQYRHQTTGPVIREKPVRESRRHDDSSTLSSSGGCTIKGNRGSNGWIYHVPGMPYYEKTRAEEMFCSEAAARAAGYRRAKVR